MARVDYYNDPAAPVANSLVPSVTAAVRNDQGYLLLIHKVDNGYWALPGGGMDLGESIADAAIREVAEESGIEIEITGLVGLYTDPAHVMAYDDGEVRQEFSVCFHARMRGGVLRADGEETRSARWVTVDELNDLSIHPSMRIRIDDALSDRTRPRIA
jgi:ADP-ribose pyrophosphatase YjhB (NUDIX family)